jgi:hypothetical protein
MPNQKSKQYYEELNDIYKPFVFEEPTDEKEKYDL